MGQSLSVVRTSFNRHFLTTKLSQCHRVRNTPCIEGLRGDPGGRAPWPPYSSFAGKGVDLTLEP